MSSRYFATLLLAGLLFLCAASATSFHFVSAALPKSPFESVCKRKLDEFEWRYVLFYQQALGMTKGGKDYLDALRYISTHHYPPSESNPIKQEDIDRVHAHMHAPDVEKARMELHKRTNDAWDCVDKFERWAAGDIGPKEWQDKSLPVSPTEPEDPNVVYYHAGNPHPQHSENDDRIEKWRSISDVRTMHPENMMPH